jgi:glycosyltransferase 2 family protein
MTAFVHILTNLDLQTHRFLLHYRILHYRILLILTPELITLWSNLIYYAICVHKGGVVLKKNVIKCVFAVAVIAVIFIFMGRTLYSNWGDISAYEWDFNYSYLGLSLLMFWGLLALLALGWIIVLRRLGVRLSLVKGLRINLLSQLGKYTPGKVWVVAGKVFLCSREGISKKVVFASSMYENILTIVAGMFLTVLFILHRQSADLKVYLLPGVACIIGGLVFVYPPIFSRLLNKVLSLLKKEPMQATLSYKSVLVSLSFYIGVWIYNGVAFYFFLNSLRSFPVNAIFDIVGILVAATLLGFLVIFAPAGLGVREGTMAMLLSMFVPMEIAIMLAVGNRVFVTVGELAMVGCFTVFARRARTIILG